MSQPASDARDIESSALREGQVAWAKADFPWLHKVAPARLESDLRAIREMDPQLILSTHLPPARRMTEQFLEALASIPGTEPSAGMSQSDLETLIADMHERGQG